jgi:GT2 family glycosyltransferase
MTAPTVSVVLPAYNALRYVGAAIDSVLQQTFTDFELLIVDDGSTDGTRDTIRSYRDPRIIVIEHDRNRGLPAGLNHALAIARGEYIARQDADDVSEPNRLHDQVAFLRRRPEVALVGAWFTVIDALGTITSRVTLPTDDLDVRWAMWFSCPFVHSAVMWRHLPVRTAVGEYNERFMYAQDYELWTRIAARFAVANIPAFLVRYREHHLSMTSTDGPHLEEGVRLRIAAAARTLGWRNTDDHTRRFRTLSALVRDSQATDMTIDEARRATTDLLALHDAMCRTSRPRPAVAHAHRQRVQARIAAALLSMTAPAADRRELWRSMRLLALASQVDWRTVARRATTRTASRPARAASGLPQ